MMKVNISRFIQEDYMEHQPPMKPVSVSKKTLDGTSRFVRSNISTETSSKSGDVAQKAMRFL